MTKINDKNLINTLPKPLKPAAKFVRHQEQASGLSTSRFIQDVTTCLIPKAVFSRSLADLTENTFLETSEETLIYFVPTILGERVARKIFSKGLDKNLKKEVATTGVELLEKEQEKRNKEIYKEKETTKGEEITKEPVDKVIIKTQPKSLYKSSLLTYNDVIESEEDVEKIVKELRETLLKELKEKGKLRLI